MKDPDWKLDLEPESELDTDSDSDPDLESDLDLELYLDLHLIRIPNRNFIPNHQNRSGTGYVFRNGFGLPLDPVWEPD
jgi:hypothetical protein